MFVTADGKVIPVDTPFTLGDLRFPSNWLRLTSEADKKAVGIRWVSDPEPVDNRFYWDKDLPKKIEDLKSQWVTQQKQTASTLLAPTDWYITRLVETETDIPADILSYRADVREVCGIRETEIEACETTGELASVVTTGGLTEWPKSPSDLV